MTHPVHELFEKGLNAFLVYLHLREVEQNPMTPHEKAKLYDHYSDYCKMSDLPPYARNTFSRKLSALGFRKEKYYDPEVKKTFNTIEIHPQDLYDIYIALTNVVPEEQTTYVKIGEARYKMKMIFERVD